MHARIQFHQHLATPALLGAVMLVIGENTTGRSILVSNGTSVAHRDSDGLAARDADDRRAHDVVQSHIDKHWIETADGWTTKFQRKNAVGDVLPGEPILLYRQVNSIEFTLEPGTLTADDKRAGVQYRAGITFPDTDERFYRRIASDAGPQGWTAWQGAALGTFATVERRHGTWRILGTDLFEGVKPNASIVPQGE